MELTAYRLRDAAASGSSAPLVLCGPDFERPALFACGHQEGRGVANDVFRVGREPGRRYAQAWCSQNPANVAAFFAETGSLSVNNGAPAVGRAAITEVARGFMTAFPDLAETMDALIRTPQVVEFHWTVTGTNTGPAWNGETGPNQWVRRVADRHERSYRQVQRPL